MRVAVAGKGGVGKTTISAVLSRTLARRGYPVIAIDCDSDPHLAMGLGLDPTVAAEMQPILDAGGPPTPTPLMGTPTPVQLLGRHGVEGPDGVSVILAARISRPGGG